METTTKVTTMNLHQKMLVQICFNKNSLPKYCPERLDLGYFVEVDELLYSLLRQTDFTETDKTVINRLNSYLVGKLGKKFVTVEFKD
jgi:hypothetical protein